MTGITPREPWRVPQPLKPLWRLAANGVLAPLITEGLVYWRAERLYWEGVIHPDGGDHEEEAEVYAAEGAETALRRLADLLGIDSGRRLPNEAATYNAGLSSLYKRLDADERAALTTLDRGSAPAAASRPENASTTTWRPRTPRSYSNERTGCGTTWSGPFRTDVLG